MKTNHLALFATISIFYLSGCSNETSTAPAQAVSLQKTDENKSHSLQNSSKNFEDNSVVSGDLKWPSEKFINPNIKYDSTKKIESTKYIDGKTQADGHSLWTVYYKESNLNEIKLYVEKLKKNGFKYSKSLNDSEPKFRFEDGFFSWRGTNEDKTQGVVVYLASQPEIYQDGADNFEYNMYIQLMDCDPLNLFVS